MLYLRQLGYWGNSLCENAIYKYIYIDLLVVGTGPGSYVTEREEGDTLLLTNLCCEHSLQKVKVKRGYTITDFLVVRAGPGSYVTISERGNTSSQTYLWCEHSLQKVKVKREKYYYWLTCGVSTHYRK